MRLRNLTAVTMAIFAVCSPHAFGHGGECNIKGNVSTRGERIYHMPGDEYYDETRISLSHGERWFCSAQEAETAGWRRSKV